MTDLERINSHDCTHGIPCSDCAEIQPAHFTWCPYMQALERHQKQTEGK